jgi:hypothetical protein
VLLAVIAWLVAAACVAVGVRRFRKIHKLSTEANALLADLHKARRSGHAWSGYPRIVSELGPVVTANSAEESVAELNEKLGEVARELSVGAELPGTSGRIGLFSGVILAVVELARTLVGAGGAALGTSGAALAAGIGAAAVGIDLDRRSRREADRTREAWNAVSALLSGARQATEQKFPRS